MGTYREVGDSLSKGRVVLDGPFGVGIYRFLNGLHSISLMVRWRLTMATTDRGGESLTPTDGTETRSVLLREAAVESLPQWTKV